MTARAELSESKGTRVIVDGVSLAYRDEGEGQTVVCLHAVGHGSRDFEQLRNQLGNTCRLVSLDWPGHGLSDCDQEPASAQRYTTLLAGFLAKVSSEPAVLLGCSIGGAAAIRHAAASPHNARALVVSDSGGLISPNPLTRGFCRAMASAYRRGQRGAWWYPAFYSAQYAMLLRGDAARSQRVRIKAAGAEMAAVLEQAWSSFADDSADIRPLVAQVAMPVLLAWARSDPYNGYLLARGALAGFPDARTKLFRGGHCPFLEQPELFANSLVGFLAELEPSERALAS